MSAYELVGTKKIFHRCTTRVLIFSQVYNTGLNNTYMLTLRTTALDILRLWISNAVVSSEYFHHGVSKRVTCTTDIEILALGPRS